MREMKDSDIEWIGKIPKDWDIKRLKALFGERKEKNDPVKTNFILSLGAAYGVVPYSEKEGGGNKAKEDLTDYRLAYPNDIVMNSMNIISGSVGISKYFGCVSPVYYMLYPRYENIDENFYCYLFQTKAFQRSLLGLGNGILIKESSNGNFNTVRMRIPMEKLGVQLLPFPPLPEQQKISAHLDIECAKIDDVITKTKATIEEYKKLKRSLIMEYTSKGTRRNKPLKPSGLEWISNIPDNWKVTKAKHILTKLERPMLPDDNIVICSNSGKTFYRGEKNTGLVSLTEDGYQGVESGDLLIHGMDTWHGAIAVSNIRGKCTSVVHVCDSKENKYFIAYYLQSLAYRNVYKAITNGVRQNTSDYRSWDKAGTIDIVVPTYEEQCEIVSLLDQKCSEIDTLIAKKEQIVTELENYKKSLIYEYVTGKREVSDMNEKEETITIFDPQATRLMQEALAYKVIKHSGDDLKGRIHLMKMIFILDIMLGLNLGINYLRYNHGPYNPIIESIEKNLSDKGIISVNTAKNYSYTVIDDSFDSKYNELFAKHNSEIEKIIDYMKRMKSSRAEKIATLYAAWNDMVIDGVQNITDKMIIDDVMNNWTENKAKTDFSTWQHILNDMKDKKIIPHGYGKHTRPRSE